MSTDQTPAQRELIRRLKSGDERAVSEWFNQFEPTVRAFISQKVSLKSDREDLIQAVFVNALRQLPLFRGEALLSTWMLSIARHEVADFYRKKYAKRALKHVPLFEQLLPEYTLHEDELSKLMASQTKEMVADVLDTMKAAYARLLRLKYLEKKSVKAISKLLGCSVKSVESDLFRARQEFKVHWRHAVKHG